MKTLFEIMIVMALIAMFTIWLLRSRRARGKVHFANIGEGTRENGIDSLLWDTANASTMATSLAANTASSGRFLLVKKTTDTDHITTCTTNDVSIGVCQDAYDANNSDVVVAVKVHGAVLGLQRVVTDGTITDGIPIKCGTNGQATAATTADAGIFGRAYLRSDMTSAAGDIIMCTMDVPSKMAF